MPMVRRAFARVGLHHIEQGRMRHGNNVACRSETVQKLGVLWTGPVAANRGRDEGRVLMKLAGTDDTVEVHEVGIGERP